MTALKLWRVILFVFFALACSEFTTDLGLREEATADDGQLGSAGGKGDSTSAGGGDPGSGGSGATDSTAGDGSGGSSFSESGGGTPVDPECGVTNVLCVGTTLKTCSGGGWVETECSGDNGTCSVSERSCLACLPGSFSCDGNVLKECADDGLTTLDTACASADQCDSMGGRCVDAGSVLDVAIGVTHTCVRLVGGTVRCWGQNYRGQLGDRELAGSATAVPVDGLVDVVDIAASNFSCASHEDGTVTCWGLDDHELFQVDGMTSTSIALVLGTVCGITELNGIQCWGSPNGGALGDPDAANRTTVDVAGVADVVQIEGGANCHTFCARTSNGEVFCWGSYDESVTTPTKLPALSDAASIAVGCDLSNNGVVAVERPVGVLQYSIVADELDSPFTTTGTASVTSFSVREGSFCFVDGLGSVRCASLGETPQTAFALGPGSATSVYGGPGGTSGKLACHVGPAGVLWCWGYQPLTGNGQPVTYPEPVFVMGGVTWVSAEEDTTAVVLEDGSALRWYPALNNRTEAVPIGSGAEKAWSHSGTHLSTLIGGGCVGNSAICNDPLWSFTSVDIQQSGGTLARRSDGVVLFDGTASHARAGGGTAEGTTGLVRVLAEAAGVTGGYWHGCAWMETGGAKCWGSNSRGVTGQGTTAGNSATPAEVVFGFGTSSIIDMCATSVHTCALADSGKIYCWGAGELFGSSTTYETYPLLVGEVPDAVDVTCNGICARTSSGEVYCLDDTPEFVRTHIDLGPIAQIVAGADHSCILTLDGDLYCSGPADRVVVPYLNYVGPQMVQGLD